MNDLNADKNYGTFPGYHGFLNTLKHYTKDYCHTPVLRISGYYCLLH